MRKAGSLNKRKWTKWWSILSLTGEASCGMFSQFKQMNYCAIQGIFCVNSASNNWHFTQLYLVCMHNVLLYYLCLYSCYAKISFTTWILNRNNTVMKYSINSLFYYHLQQQKLKPENTFTLNIWLWNKCDYLILAFSYYSPFFSLPVIKMMKK